MFAKTYATVGLFTLLAVAPAFAEQPLQATIPFDFTIGSTRMHAGDYAINFEHGGLVWVKRADGKASYALLTIPLRVADSSEPGRLVFNKYGSSYFLSQIWSRGYNGRQLRKSKAELETESASNAVRDKAVIAAVSAREVTR